MSGKLDQSLEDIVMTERKGSKGRLTRGRRVAKVKGRPTAPSGGVSKNSKPSKNTKATGATSAGALSAIATNANVRDGGKILVSGLPSDVNEVTIKDYFQKQIGNVRKVLLTYGPNGQSRGVATVIFSKATSAMQAVKDVNGLTIDGTRTIKVEIIVGADKAMQPAKKSMGDRLSQPKSAGKANAKAKPKAKMATADSASKDKKGRTKRPPKNARPKRKTAEELDAEMTDYFGDGSNAMAAAPVGVAAKAEAMDEIQ